MINGYSAIPFMSLLSILVSISISLHMYDSIRLPSGLRLSKGQSNNVAAIARIFRTLIEC
jgi:hypothetical protein